MSSLVLGSLLLQLIILVEDKSKPYNHEGAKSQVVLELLIFDLLLILCYNLRCLILSLQGILNQVPYTLVLLFLDFLKLPPRICMLLVSHGLELRLHLFICQRPLSFFHSSDIF